MTTHSVEQPILIAQIACDETGNPCDYVVGKNCTHIEPCSKGGEFCDIPYIRVWNGSECLAEFSQHRAGFVKFGPKSA